MCWIVMCHMTLLVLDGGTTIIPPADDRPSVFSPAAGFPIAIIGFEPPIWPITFDCPPAGIVTPGSGSGWCIAFSMPFSAPELPGALDVPDAIVPGSSLTTPGIPTPAPTLSAIGSWANTLPTGTGTVDSPAGASCVRKDEAQCSQMMDRSVTVWCTS
uniref:Uncharacterized protein n=1 Tax=Anopheles merus TaxID=30066 RepID=A0A182V7I3_ANOME